MHRSKDHVRVVGVPGDRAAPERDIRTWDTGGGLEGEESRGDEDAVLVGFVAFCGEVASGERAWELDWEREVWIDACSEPGGGENGREGRMSGWR